MRADRKTLSRLEPMNGWPEIVTLWALESDGRRRDRILAAHSLLMKVVERGALEAFRRSVDDPRFDGCFTLSCGIGYDLERLEEELDVVFRDGNSATVPVRTRLDALYDRTLVALGDARREAGNCDESARQLAFRELVRATERLYDRIERMVGATARREFIADGVAKTTAWLDVHKDENDRIAAQLRRLSEARRRMARE
jgi:hypothetical protein